MVSDAIRAERALLVADADLDRAWRSGVGVEQALALAKRLSREIGRDPVIEDAKVELAGSFGCSPSEAFEQLAEMSRHTNRKLSEVARVVVESASSAAAD